MKNNKINLKHFSKHETKKHVLLKFLIILIIFLSYFAYVAFEYGLQQGVLVAALTWSFFVLCTPVADAGFLIDFPLRLATNFRMITLEIFVWIIAISLNLYTFFLMPETYSKTEILVFFKHILESPFPFWAIILVSLIGTFVSIRFGDELLDKVQHKERAIYHKHKHSYRLIAMVFLFGITFVLYDFLLQNLGVNLPI